MDVQDSFNLRVEQITIAVGVQLQLTIQPGLLKVGAEGCRIDLAQRPVGVCRRHWLRQWHCKMAGQQMLISEAHRLNSHLGNQLFVISVDICSSRDRIRSNVLPLMCVGPVTC